MSAKFEIPYKSVDEAIQDGFKKIGGKEDAFTMLRTGYYQIHQRKEQNMKNQKLRELVANDPRFKGLLEHAKSQLKKGA